MAVTLWSFDSDFIYRKLPEKYLHSDKELSAFQDQLKKELPKAVYVEHVLPKGFVKNGSIDYTSFIQQVLDKNNVVVFPSFPLLVNEEGLTIKSNQVLIFSQGSKLRIKPNNLRFYEILRIHNVENIKIYNADIAGDRDNHKGTSGEWGMGISIKGSVGVKIINPKVEKCWGDGIYIGKSKNGPCRDIEVYNALLDNNRRNGISITSGENVRIERPVISNTNGTNPQSGLDIEPNGNSDLIKNIFINNAVTYNNAHGGVILSLSGLIGEQKKDVSIFINNHKDYESSIGLSVGLSRKKTEKDGPRLSGVISVKNSTWSNNLKKGMIIYKAPYNGIELDLKDIKILKTDKDGKEYYDLKTLSEVKETLKKINIK